ncbi:hypothetical protein [Mucilaginibacter flavidus]|uniref:hypothetical protein n=1 Tax=Mucilaginibacter flavidus TaxID=2949309 RepID=UPI002093645A|nr:hypothetical protein [Mucilaginibacter flavidus]MCO5949296.1 hypothetical protein [Mucilaginibacter flavidus]
MKPDLLLIGCGPMAVAYAEVLMHMIIPFKVIGRGEATAAEFERQTGVKPVTGGLDLYLQHNNLASGTYVIVSTNLEGLMESTLKVLESGAYKILVEKPGALSIDELLVNKNVLLTHSRKVFVAYNRRFYSAVTEASRLIAEDGGLQSMSFEFTEWAHVIEPLKKAPGIKENWFFANSTHVVDLAFYLAGAPSEMSCYSKSGSLTWHDKTNFSGAGITDSGILFSYLSNWESAGRWAIELLTKERRIYLKPMEKVSLQLKGSIKIEEHLFDDSLDKEFKPGIYKQVEAFLNDDHTKLLNIADHIKNAGIYKQMLAK